MKKTLICLSVLILFGGGCVSIQTNNTTLPTPTDDNPVVDTPTTSNLDTIEGVLEASLFGGTEMGCMFNDEAVVGDQLTCNTGLVGLALQTDDKLVHLTDYQCDAVEIFIKEAEGYRVEYETSNCTGNLVQGSTYSLEGTLTEMKDQWRNGEQQDEWWFDVTGSK